MKLDNEQLDIIGSTEYIDIDDTKNIPAKIDTGADTSSIWVSNIEMQEDGVLTFTLFDKKCPLYTGERLKTTNYTAKVVRSSHGDSQVRYCVNLPVSIKGKTFKTMFTLANRSRNHFPVLIGRHTLKGKFLVDVSQSAVARQETVNTPKINRRLKEDPQGFHEEYIAKERSTK